jgi:hypothetical protein
MHGSRNILSPIFGVSSTLLSLRALKNYIIFILFVRIFLYKFNYKIRCNFVKLGVAENSTDLT